MFAVHFTFITIFSSHTVAGTCSIHLSLESIWYHTLLNPSVFGVVIVAPYLNVTGYHVNDTHSFLKSTVFVTLSYLTSTTVLQSHAIVSCVIAFAVNHAYVFAVAAVEVFVVQVLFSLSATTSV